MWDTREMHTGYLLGNPEGKRSLGIYVRVCGRITLIWNLRETWWEGVEWVNLAQNRDNLRAVVHTVMKVWIPQNAGVFSRI